MKARAIVRLKSEVHDPQGETIHRALKTIGFDSVTEVRQGKYFELTLEGASREEAEAQAREITARVLSNPILEIFQVEVHE